MKVYVKGQGQPIDLTQKDYVATGGEGSIYARGSVAFKIYTDPAKMIPVGKIQELAAITEPRVIKPENVLTDRKGNPVGYTMRFVKESWALCQIFPRVFRERNGITHAMILDLIRQLQESVDHVHKAGVLIVDLNEMNFLVAKKFNDIYFIDADSYQTRSYPATAIMPSIRDWKTPLHQFTEGSDWFSFGIVSFQMWTGIHPFKGKHPKVQGLDERMQAGISVFNKDVGIPSVVYPFSVIPAAYRAWYEAIFEKGVRCPPPTDGIAATIVVMPVVKAVSGTAQLDIMEIGEFDGPVIRLWADDTHLVVVTDKSVWLDNHRVMAAPKSIDACGFSPRVCRPVLVTGENAIPTLINLADQKEIPFGLAATGMSSYDGRIYARAGERIYEIILTDAGNQVIASTKEAAQVLEHATQLYPGVAVQNLLGSVYVSLLTAPGETHQVQIKELDKYRILDARFDRGVLMVVGEKKGKYDRLVFRFDSSDYSYDMRVVKDITPAGLNFVTLDTGICVCLDEDEKLELFSNRKGSAKVKTIEDSVLGGDMTLVRQGGQLLFSRGNKIYRMKMK